ncbi:MAG: JmjC domain-containing protein [Allosphingosinicella sp.]
MPSTAAVTNPDATGGISEKIGGDAFFRDVWQRRWTHLVQAFSAEELNDLLPLDALDRLVFSGGLGSPNLQLLANGRAVDVPQTASIAPATDTGYLFQAFRSGSSFRIQHLENYLPEVASFCRRIEGEFGFPIRANVYVSPSNSAGLAPHYDSSEVFVVQVVGEKRWRIFEDYTNRLPLPLYEARFNPSRQKPVGDPVEVALKSGDILYLPRGMMHSASTGQQSVSIHVTFAVLGLTWIDMIGTVLRRASQDHEELRRLVPIGEVEGMSDEEIADKAAALLGDTSIRHWVLPFVDEIRSQYAVHKPQPRYGALAEIWREGTGDGQ